MGFERPGASLDVEGHVQRPVFLGDEGIDLILPVRDQAQGHRLHTAGGESSFDLCPQNRRDLIADHAVQNAAGLLRIHEIHVNITGIFEGLRDCLLGDFVESNPGDLFVGGVLQLQGGFQMPGNGFSFAVRVRCQIDAVSLFDHLAQPGEKFSFAPDRDVTRLIIMLNIDPHLTLGKISDMPVGGRHLIRGSEKFLDRFHLCR